MFLNWYSFSKSCVTFNKVFFKLLTKNQKRFLLILKFSCQSWGVTWLYLKDNHQSFLRPGRIQCSRGFRSTDFFLQLCYSDPPSISAISRWRFLLYLMKQCTISFWTAKAECYRFCTNANEMATSFFSVKCETAIFIASIFIFLSLSRYRHRNILFFISFTTHF